MHYKIKKYIFGLLLFVGFSNLYSQTPNTQDCNGAIQVCQPTISATASIGGEGNIPAEITPTLSCLFGGENNGSWYQFTTQSAGLLCFTIDPVNNNQDYDFGLFNLTGNICSSIATTASLSAACNYNTQTTWYNVGGGTDPSKLGTTGLFPVGTYTNTNAQTGSCISVPSGASYALYISSFSFPNAGYTLSFPPNGTIGMANVIDETIPQLLSIISSTACGATSIKVLFSEDILCNTVSAADFQLTGPGGITYNITGLSGVNCGMGSYKEKIYTLNVSPALTTGGTYQLCLTNSAGSVSDPCGNLAPAACMSFSVNGPISTFIPINSETCKGTAVTFSNTGIGTTHAWIFQGGSPASASTNSSAVTWNNAGTYTITHTETTGTCSSVSSTTIIVNPSPTATLLASNPSCSLTTGSATVTPSGGTPGYTYNWLPSGGNGNSASGLSPSSTYTVELSDSKNCKIKKTVTIGPIINTSATFISSPNQCLSKNSYTFTNTGTPLGIHSYSFSPISGSPSMLTGTSVVGSFSSPGTYTVFHNIDLGVNCSFTKTLQVTVFPNPTAINFTTLNSKCSQPNGTITVSGTTGGTPGYQYNLNGSGYSNTTSYNNLIAGTYTLGVQDLNGCVLSSTLQITDSPSPTSIVYNTTPSSCGINDGTITFTNVIGGAAPYSYSFNGGPFIATSPITGLGVGGYNLVVKDVNNCTYTASINITNPLSPTGVVITTTNTACVGNTGIINIGAVTGGSPTFSFSVDGSSFTTLTSYTSQAAGSHPIIVKDANNCTYNTSIIVGMELGPTSVALTPIHISCGGINGEINIGTITGGIPNYLYSLDGSLPVSNTSFTGLAAGIHTIVTTDGNGCTHTGTINIIYNSNPTASLVSSINVSCNGASDGTAKVLASAGTPGYTFTLNPNTISNGTGLFSGMPANSYTVTVKDAANCITTQTLIITEPPPLTSSITLQTNVSCFGGNDGLVTLTGVGGNVPYQYSFNGGTFQASNTFSLLTAANSSVTIKDNRGCTINQNVIITQPAVIDLVLFSSPANCNQSDGSATVLVNGGIPAYTYTWTGGGGNTPTSNGVVPGTYFVTVQDNNSCIKTGSVIVNVKGGAIVTIASVTDASCNGFTNGSIVTSMVGPNSPPYSYTWTPNVGSGPNANNLAPGTYTVTSINVFGCISSATAVVAQPPVLNLNLSSIAASCNGGNDATGIAMATGGTSSYNYLWLPTASTLTTITGLAGTYTCTVTDAKSCVKANTITLGQPNPLSIIPTYTLPGCNQSNGSASITATSGGTAPYTYSWSTGATGPLLTNVSAGTYTCIVTDANLCVKSFPVNVINPASPTISVTSVINVSCNSGNNGSISILASGGMPTYNYLWSNGQSSPNATNLSAGNYGVTVTDQNGCKATQNITVSEPIVLTISTTFTEPKCVGSANGSSTAFPNGGTLPYTYLWNSTPTQTTSSVTNLVAGLYSVTVKDANLCTATQTVLLTDPLPLTVSVTPIHVSCYSACNGSATAVVDNAVGTVSYFWNDPNNQATQTASFLCLGNYSVMVTDGNNCIASGNVSITQPPPLTATISTFGNVSCNGGNNGYAQVTPFGGTPGYTYLWSNGSLLASSNNLVATTYSVEVTDSKNCTVTTQILISEPLPLTAVASSTDATCFGLCNGQGSVNYSGGTGPYTFLWQPSLQTVFSADNLCIGTHSITVKDINNCEITTSIIIDQPSVLSVTNVAISSNCGQANGSSCAQVTGGHSPYTYLWSNGITSSCNNNITAGFYTVTVTDSKTCTSVGNVNINDIAAPTVSITSSSNISCFSASDGTASAAFSGGVAPFTISWLPSNQNTLNVTNLNPGTHNIIVTDSAGCIGSNSIIITEPSKLFSLTSNIENVKCFGACTGSVTALVTGGTFPYSYSWNDVNAQTDSLAINLCAGFYTCTITDSKNCITNSTVAIIESPVISLASNTVTSISCFGYNNGSVIVNVTGGVPGYLYTWSPSGGNNNIITNLTPNTYSVEVTDSYGCKANRSFLIHEPAILLSTFSSTNSACFTSNGSASITATGGTPGYNYNWNTNPLQQTALATGLAAGDWVYTVADTNGCSITDTVTILNTLAPIIDSVTFIKPLCNGQLNGSISIWGTSSANPPMYTWIGNNTTTSPLNTLTGIGAGSYTIQMKDMNNCITTSFITVIEPSPLSVNTSSNITICYGQSTQIYAAGTGGTPPYTYNWTPNNLSGPGLHLINPSTSTIYSLSITDGNNCFYSGNQIAINVRPPLSAISTATSGCDGDSVLLNAIIVGGTGGPYTYAWSNGSTTSSTQVLLNIAANPTLLNIVVGDGCSSPLTNTIGAIVNPKPSADFTSDKQVGCEDLSVLFSATVSGTLTNSFNWNFGDGSFGTGPLVGHIYTEPGKYTDSLLITNTFGCSSVIVKNNYIEVYPSPVAEFTLDPVNSTILYPTVNFTDQSTLAVSWLWDFNDINSGNLNNAVVPNTSHDFNLAGNFFVKLLVTSKDGCQDYVIHPVAISPEFTFYVPNAFTPDKNGKNDVFQPVGLGIDKEQYKMTIYDRWGVMIFTSTNFDVGWNGYNQSNVLAENGVYVWQISVFDLTGEEHKLMGHVTLLR